MENKQLKLHFLGGAGTVTGSKTLIEFDQKRVLIDCGLFQGLKELRNLNRSPFPVSPDTIDVLILTHAHLDHCGYIPLLVKNGFSGEIHCTSATAELAEIILRDSAKIQEEDAERAARHSYSKHPKPEPLYTTKDVLSSLKLFVTHEFSEWVIIHPGIKFQFLNNGHILGSGFVELKIQQTIFLFSGDIGKMQPLLMYPPKHIKEADYVVLESTYGDRLHDNSDVKEELLAVIEEVWADKGILMIPSFAVERTQELIYLLYLLKEENRLPAFPIYLDSPMGVNSSKVYFRYSEQQNIPADILRHMYDQVHFITDAEVSKRICLDRSPKIVLAGSGMIEGGRIIHYLNNHMQDKQNTLLFVGFQGEGTRGRAIQNGSREIKFYGQYHKVNCKIRSISSLSAHGDQKDLLTWLKYFKKEPRTIFLNHGEPHQTDALRVKIEHELGWNCETPKMNDTFVLDIE
ncbi:MAG: MBL fold metallo-hydrolase [Bacteroidetes bacterium]|nr:MAG: MBL fold metallo-hydrolase [Bacteroidota bacterium]